MQIEVFRTNVKSRRQASVLAEQLQTNFEDYRVNFDLDDCDRILRIVRANGAIRSDLVIELLRYHGVEACVLPDDCPEPLEAQLYFG